MVVASGRSPRREVGNAALADGRRAGTGADYTGTDAAAQSGGMGQGVS